MEYAKPLYLGAVEDSLPNILLSGKHMTTKRRVYFTLEAPGASDVQVAGNFNDWSFRPLKQQKDGVWKTWTTLEPGTYEYRYIVDGEWTNTPDAELVENSFGSTNCVEHVS